jgi:hypothetical protein
LPQADSAAPPAPPPAAAAAAAAPVGPGRVYAFLWEEQRAELFVASGQTVADARLLVAERFGSLAEYVTLLYGGRQLRDDVVLERLRVPPAGHVAVYIRDMSALFVRSVRMNDPGRDRPDDYEALLERLIAATGARRLDCARCLRFCGYDYGAALEALRDAG